MIAVYSGVACHVQFFTQPSQAGEEDDVNIMMKNLQTKFFLTFKIFCAILATFSLMYFAHSSV